jgi:DNA-binding protein Fis
MRWTVQKASVEFGLHRETLAKYLRREGIQPGADGKFSTQEIVKGVYGDLRTEQTRETRLRADKIEMENAEKRRELLSAQSVVELLEGSFLAIKSKITSSHLSEAEQNAILLDLVGLRENDVYELGRQALLAEFRAATVAAAG